MLISTVLLSSQDFEMSLIYPRSSRLLSNICWRLVFSRADSNLSLRKLQDDEYVLALCVVFAV